MDNYEDLKRKIHLEDPIAVLESLGLNIKNSYGKYKFASVTENTPSAEMKIKDGIWKYRNYSSNATYGGGTIENVVMEVLKKNYFEALEYCSKTLFNEDIKNVNSLADKKLIDELLKSNKSLEKRNTIDYEILEWNKINEWSNTARVFLRDRGIYHCPSNSYNVKVAYTLQNKDNSTFTVTNEGIAMPFGNMEDVDIIGAKENGFDMHIYNPYVKKDGSKLKSQTFGNKGISVNYVKDSKEINVCESKMDYYSSNYLEMIKNNNNISSNGTGEVKNVIKEIQSFLEKNHLKEEDITIRHLNQNDTAGYIFNSEIMQAFPNANHKMFKYKENEFKYDINDLIKKGVNLEDRQIDASLQHMKVLQVNCTVKELIRKVCEITNDPKIEEYKLNFMNYVFKNMGKYKNENIPNLLIDSDFYFKTNTNIYKTYPKDVLEDNKIDLNNYPYGTLKYVINEHEGKKLIDTKMFYTYQDTVLRNHKNYKDSYSDEKYFIEDQKQNEFSKILEKQFEKQFGLTLSKEQREKNFTYKNLSLFNKVASNLIEDGSKKDSLCRLSSLILYNRISNRDIHTMGSFSKDILLLCSNQETFKENFKTLFDTTNEISKELNLDTLIKDFKANNIDENYFNTLQRNEATIRQR